MITPLSTETKRAELPQNNILTGHTNGRRIRGLADGRDRVTQIQHSVGLIHDARERSVIP